MKTNAELLNAIATKTTKMTLRQWEDFTDILAQNNYDPNWKHCELVKMKLKFLHNSITRENNENKDRQSTNRA